MRVVQVIDILYYGGAQTMQVMFASVVRNSPDIELTVVSLRDNIQNTPIPDQLKSLGVKVVFCSARKLWDPQRFWKLIKFLQEENFDVVHTHLPYSNIIGTLAGRLTGIPVIASIRNSRDDDWGKYFFLRNGLETLVLRFLASRVMAVGYSTAKVHQKRLGSQKIEAVPNAINVIAPLMDSERNRIRTELVGNPTFPMVISAGRLVQQKGYEDLIRAFAIVLRSYPKASLVIAGDGPLHDNLLKIIDTLGIEGKIKLLGARNDIDQLLAASDLFVSSSHWEGLSVAILEAMAAGLPIVATNVSDTPRIVVDGVGLIVPPHSPKLLAESINFFLEDSIRRQAYGSAARTFILENHDPDVWANKIISLYNSVQ